MCGFCALPTLYFDWKLERGEKKSRKMVIFSELTVVLESRDIVLFSRAVRTCGLHRRGNCSCGRYIVCVLDSRRGIIWLALCLECLRKEVSSNSNSAGLIAERLASNSAVGLTNDLGWGFVCGFGQSWESPLIWALWVFCNYKWQQLVLFVAIPGTDACSYYMIHSCQTTCGFLSLDLGKFGASSY